MITAHIATIPSRESSLRLVLNAISPQVDKIYVSLNGYQVEPDWLHTIRNVEAEIYDNSLGDSAKLIKCFPCQGICFVLDDDLTPSPNLIHWMQWGLNKYKGVVGLHGRIYPRPVTHFKKWVANYRCLGNVAEDIQNIDLIGTGVMMFDNRQVKLDNSVFEYKNMLDVLFSRLCHKQGIPMTILKHNSTYLKYIPPIDGHTIWRDTKDYSIQTEILNSFLK